MLSGYEIQKMPLEVEIDKALSWRISSFKPSDREQLNIAFKDPDRESAAFSAVLIYLDGWKKSEWIEEYSIERVGKWIGKNAPGHMVNKYLEISGSDESVAYKAFNIGLRESIPENAMSFD